MNRPALLLTVVAVLVAGLAGCGRSAPTVHLPDARAPFDYQLGGAYPPPQGTRTVERDRTAKPAAGRYNICYVNAFQAQPGDAAARWRRDHPGLLLHDARGREVVDRDWGEPLLDTSTPAKRRALAAITGRWIDGCADAGYDAVEFDNLDSYTRSGGRLTRADALAQARLLTARAHARGLAAAQKNTADLLPSRRRAGFDFAVVEECARYDECGTFAAAYGNRILDVEYRRQDLAKACGHAWPTTLRDRDLVARGAKGYVFRAC